MDWRSGVIVVEKKFLETLYQVNVFVTCKVGAPIKSCGLELGSGRENNQLLSRDQTATDGTSKQELRRLKSFLDPKYKGMHKKKTTHGNNTVPGLLNLETPFRPSVFSSPPINFILWEGDCQSNFKDSWSSDIYLDSWGWWQFPTHGRRGWKPTNHIYAHLREGIICTACNATQLYLTEWTKRLQMTGFIIKTVWCPGSWMNVWFACLLKSVAWPPLNLSFENKQELHVSSDKKGCLT